MVVSTMQPNNYDIAYMQRQQLLKTVGMNVVYGIPAGTLTAQKALSVFSMESSIDV